MGVPKGWEGSVQWQILKIPPGKEEEGSEGTTGSSTNWLGTQFDKIYTLPPENPLYMGLVEFLRKIQSRLD